MSLDIQNISKSFGQTKVLKGVSLQVKRGEVLALLGENGAGKSTLIKIISGIHKHDSGTIKLDGKELNFSTPAQAMSEGVVLIPQELRVIPKLTVAENVMLGQISTKKVAGLLPVVDHAQMHKTVQELLSELGIPLDPAAKAEDLDFASRQLIVIARALSRQAKVLILDEPTASLESQEVERLFKVIKQLRNQGVAIIYISHRLEEIEELANTCVVLRDGIVAATLDAPPYVHEDLYRAMTGKELQEVEMAARTPEEIRTAVTIECPKKATEITCRKKQIVGLSGLLGSGTTALLHRIFGSEKNTPQAMSQNSVRQAITNGIGFVPGERARGLVMSMSIRDNIILPHIDQFTTLFGRDEKRIDEVVNTLMEEFDIRPRDASVPVGQLSGGNQQKVIFAKWMTGYLDLLLLDEPTNGIDIAAKHLIHRYIDQFTLKGGSVFLSSTDLTELLNLSDQIVVMRQGSYVGSMDKQGEDSQFGEQKLRSLLGVK